MAFKYKVGVGGHYTDWADAWNALVAIGTLNNDYEFEQISDVTVTAWPNTSLAVNRFQPNGHSIRFYCQWENSHQGDPTKGYITNLSGANGRIWAYFNDNFSATNLFTIENLYLKQITNNASMLLLSQQTVSVPTFLMKIRYLNLLIEGFSSATTSITGISVPDPHLYYHISNIKIWNVDRALDLQGSGYGSFAPVDGYANNHIVENISISQTKGVTAAIESQQFTALPHRLVVLRNIFSFNCASSKSWDQAINSVMNRIENCADDDGSLAVAIAGGFTNYSDVFSNVDDALEIESFDDTNSDFLHLKKGALAVSANATPDKGKAPLRVRFNSDIDYLWPAGMQLYNGGAVPSLSVNDIAGEQYGKYGDYPIGCHNAEVAY